MKGLDSSVIEKLFDIIAANTVVEGDIHYETEGIEDEIEDLTGIRVDLSSKNKS